MTLLSTFIPTAASDIIGIFNQEGDQVLVDARPTGVTVVRDSLKFTHPLENNTSRADGKIILPVQITYSVVLQSGDYESAYSEINRYFLSSEELIVQTKARSFGRMIVTAMPHKEEPQLFDAIVVDISLEETQIATTLTVANDEAFSTTNRGQAQPQTPSATQESQGSVLFQLFGG